MSELGGRKTLWRGASGSLGEATSDALAELNSSYGEGGGASSPVSVGTDPFNGSLWSAPQFGRNWGASPPSKMLADGNAANSGFGGLSPQQHAGGAVMGGAPSVLAGANLAYAAPQIQSDATAAGPGRFGVDLTQTVASHISAAAGAYVSPVQSSAVTTSPVQSTGAMQAVTPPAPSTATLSGPELLDFTRQGAVALGNPSVWSLQNSLYENFPQTTKSGSGDGFDASATFSVAGGIRGAITVTPASITPNFPLEMNPEVLDYVQQGQTFSVKPTLISTDGAGFSLNMPTATANLSFALSASADVSLSFPSVTVGWSVFSHTFHGPTINESPSGSETFQLPVTGTAPFPSGSISVSKISDSQQQATPVFLNGDTLATVSQTFYTDPFLTLNLDAIKAIPKLSSIDGSQNFGVGSASWSLLSLPMSASLKLADTVTTSQVGFTEDLQETIKGVTTNLGTYAVGHEWDLVAPSYSGPGYGVIALEEDYALTLNVHSVLSLFGSFNMTLNGPAASASIFGEGFSVGPIFSFPLLSESGDIATISTTDTQVVVTATQRELVFYGTNAVSVTLTNSQQTSFDLAASGALLTINSGVYISPATNTGASTIGVQATLGADGVYNYGSVYAQPGTGSVGVDLVKGGKLVNGGDINANLGGGHYRGKIQYGVEIGGRYSTIINKGAIGGDVTGIAAISGSTDDTLFVYNNAGATISGSKYGVSTTGALIDLHNDGTITGASGVGVVGGGAGLFLYNNATGVINGGGAASVTSGGFGFIENQGKIDTSGTYGVRLTQGDVFNFGSIVASSIGVQVGQSNRPSSAVYNGGLIEATNNGGYAVKLLGPTNTLSLKPGSTLIGGVTASGSVSGNAVELLAGAGMGTLLAGIDFNGFGRINIAGSASWFLQTEINTDFNGATISGLSGLDLIGVQGLQFQYGDKVTFNQNTGVMSLLNPGGTNVGTFHLSGLTGARFSVWGTPSETFIREFTGAHLSNVITRSANGQQYSLPSQIINSNSYFGPTAGNGIIIPQDEGVEYLPAAYPTRKFGIDLQPITVASTVVTGGVTSVVNVVQPALLYNHGFVTGYQEGVLLQTGGTIFNENEITSQKVTYTYSFGIKSKYTSPFGDGILVTAGSTYAKIVNYGSNLSAGQAGFIYGQNGIVLDSAGVIQNVTSSDHIYGSSDGVVSVANATIQNAGSIVGNSGVGVALGHDFVVYNASTGVITGGVDGVSGSGAADVIANAGSIGGQFGVVLSKGGAVSNTYNMVGGVPVWGTITGAKYAVEVLGAAGDVTNGYAPIIGGASRALMTGVFLAAGGNINNGKYGVINAAGAFGVVLGSAAAATLSNGGVIGAIRAARGDHIGNKASGSIQSVTAIGGSSSNPLTIANAGVIGAGASGAGISSSVATYLYNIGTIDNGIQFASGTIMDFGVINGRGGGNAITFGAAASTLIVNPGAYFNGNVVGNAADTLELAGYDGSLAGLGSQIAGFGKTVVDAGSAWTLSGQNSLAGKWTIAGIVAEDSSSSLTVVGSVAVTGVVRGAAANSPTDGVSVASSGTLNNSGVIRGGRGISGSGADGVDVSGGVVVNSGSIIGGSDVAPNSYGGFGVYLGGGVLTNSGQITGGASPTAAYLPPGGVFVGSGTLINSGTISGASGAHAVDFLDNTGKLVLRPGAAFNGLVVGSGGVLDLSGGANGVLTGLGSEFTGFGQVTEDAGSSWTLTGANTVANAITLISGATLTVAGSLQKSGGGPAVYLDGGVLVNATTLASSIVQFASVPGTIGITPTASFSGVVAAPAGAGDTLLLEGAGGALSGLGTQYTNFGTLGVASGATWTMAATTAFSGGLAVSGFFGLTGGTQTIGGVLSGAGVISVGGNSVLDLAGKGTVAQAIGGAGTVEVQGVLSLNTSAFHSGALKIDAGGALTGVGAIRAPVVDNGLLSASGGTLTVTGPVSGTGTLAVASGASLVLNGGGTFAGALVGVGTIDFAAPFTLASGASLRVNNVVESANLTLAQGESLINNSGRVFNIVTTSGAPVTLVGAGSNTITNGGTFQASGSGSAIVQPRLINAGLASVNGGSLTLSGTVTNTGTISAAAGLLTVQQGVGGTGAMTVGSAGTLALGGAVASTQTVDLTDSGLLELGSPLGFQAAIADFNNSVGIDLLSTPVTNDSYANNILTLLNGSSVVGKLHFAGTYTLSSFHISSDNQGGSLIASHA